MSSIGSQRTRSDTWDLSSGVGATATIVAAGRALASRGPAPLLDDPYAEPLVRAVGNDFFARLLDGDIGLEPAGSPLTEQQRREQIAVRTRYYDNFLLQAVDGGVRQVVILAAGLDARAYRLAWPTGTVVFEIDQPDVIEFKTKTLAGLCAGPAVDRRAVGVDLREDWVGALRDAFFDSSTPTAWIAEGLLVYLPPDAQDRLLDHITEMSPHGSSLATEHFSSLSVFTTQRSQAWRKRWTNAGFDLDIGDLVWAGDRHPPADYLTSTGWNVTTHEMADLYASNGFTLPDEEVASFLGEGYLSGVLERTSAQTSI